MMPSPLSFACDASLQAFVNCYLREVDGGVWYPVEHFESCSGLRFGRSERHVVEIELPKQGKVLAIGVSYRSLVGRHTLTQVYQRAQAIGSFHPIDGVSAQLLLIDSIYSNAPESAERLELISRVIESHQVMARYLGELSQQGEHSKNTTDSFIKSEQSVLLGHWLHPTPKSRPEIVGWQHSHYCPELGGRFQLHFFAVRRRLVEQCSILETTAEEMCRQLAYQGPETDRMERLIAPLGDVCLLPLHPLQAQWLLHQNYVLDLFDAGDLVDLGRLGPAFTPTSSVRTVYSESAEFMLKLSIPVRITNSLRINLNSELGDSVWISQLLRECDLSVEFPQFRPIVDPAYITLALPGLEETGFEVIFRSSPFRNDLPEETVHSIAALVQEPLPGQAQSLLSQLVHASAEFQGIAPGCATFQWFDAYWNCAIKPTIRIYDEFGIALEAHQQNSLLGFNDHGTPQLFYYRDLQGLALSETCRDRLVSLVPELAHQHKVFEPDDIVRNGLGYYLFFNHLYAVINRLALDGLAEEMSLLKIVHEKLVELRTSMNGLGVPFIDGLLEDAVVPCKANLLTRIQDMDELQTENELAIYCMVKNPLRLIGASVPNRGSAPLEMRTGQSAL